MELEIQKVLKTNVDKSSSMAVVGLKDPINNTIDELAYVACAGAGALLLPFNKDNFAKINAKESFLYESPAQSSTPGSCSPSSPVGSPSASPRSSPVPKLTRVNKSNCLDANTNTQLVAIGELGGYMPRILLFDLQSRKCIDFLRDQHSFGVEFVKFSPSGRFLLSLGNAQDGFLYIYNVCNNRLDTCAVNKCISEVRDVCWISETQFVTVGVRHIKIWTFENSQAVHGRNVVLGPLVDLAFDTVTRSSDSRFLVGASNGCIYEMPDSLCLVDTQDQQPFRSLSVQPFGSLSGINGEEEYPMVLASTSTHTYVFEHGFTNIKTVYDFGCNSIRCFDSNFYGGFSSDEYNFLTRIDLDNPKFNPLDEGKLGNIRSGLKLRTCDQNEVICWYVDDNCLIRWPHTELKLNLENVSSAYFSKDPEIMIAGSITGDVFINGEVHLGHNGPVTDCHVVRNKAITSGRDRFLKLWIHEGLKWSLYASQVFTSHVLKSQICVNSFDEAVYASFCGNKTLYFSIVDDYNTKPSLKSLKSVTMRGMVYDMKSVGHLLVVSTNDRLVSVFDAFADSKLKHTWKPKDSNDESVNLLYIQPIKYENQWHLLGASSNKCVLLYHLTTGDIVASQWGHSEAITGVAFTGDHVISASDNVFISKIVAKKSKVSTPQSPTRGTPQSPMRSPSRPRSPTTRLESSPPPRSPVRIPRSPTADSVINNRQTIPKLNDPKLNPFNITQQPSTKPILSPTRSRPASPTPVRPPSPRRLPNPVLSTRPSSSSKPVNTDQELETALKEFLAKTEPTENDNLKNLLISALVKVDGLSFADTIGERIYSKVEEKINNMKN